MQLTKNFNLSEFACNDGTPVPPEFLDNVAEVAKNLQVLRDELDFPVTINSGYRSPAYNKEIGGVSNSQHLQAKAADIVCSKYTVEQLYKTVIRLIEEGKMRDGGVGRYDTFVQQVNINYKSL